MRAEPREDEQRTRLEMSLPGHAARPAGASEPPLTGRIGGRYTLLRELGRGGMGTVYSAYDEELDRKVAIKVIREAQAGSLGGPGSPRLLAEAQALARLSHPNVVQIYDVGVSGDLVFLAMEHVTGATLREWQRAASRGWRELLGGYRQAGEGLAAAHAAGLIHRDVKPDNLMIGDDQRVRVMDFGLARRGAEARDPVTEAALLAAATAGPGSRGRMEVSSGGRIMGTPAYMPPEQLRGESVGAEADMFAFCVSLWEGLYGARPFIGATVAELRERVEHGQILAPPAGHPAPRWLREVLQRGLAAEPALRWSSMRALLAALDEGLARMQRWRALRWLAAASAAAVALGFAVMGWAQAQETARVASCERLGAASEQAWDDAARARMREAMRTSGLPHAAATVEGVLPRLDAWAAEWRAVRVASCLLAEAEEGWTAGLRGRAQECLEERMLGFAALISELSTQEATVVGRAVEATASLPTSRACREPLYLARRPALPAVGLAEVHAVRAKLARLRALEAAGKYAEGEGLAEETLDAAMALGWAPALAEARMWLGVFELRRGKREAAAVSLEAAYFAGMRASALETAADAANWMIYVVGNQLGRREEGLRWARHTELVLLALARDEPSHHEVDRLNNRGLVYQAAGEHRQSAEDLTAALTLAEQVYGPKHPMVAVVLGNLAITEGQLGALVRAREAAARALAIAEEALGPDHPVVAGNAKILGIRTAALAIAEPDASAAVRGYDAAIELFQRSLAISLQVHGEVHSRVGDTLRDLAHVRLLRGEVAGIEAIYARALAIQRELRGADDPSVALLMVGLGEAQRHQGQLQAAAATLGAALGILQQSEKSDELGVAAALHQLGSVYLDQGDLESARTALEAAYAIRQRLLKPIHAGLAGSRRSLALLEILSGDENRGEALLAAAAPRSNPILLAQPRFALAKALWARGPAQAARARALAELAREGFLHGGERMTKERAALAAWLQALPGEP